MSASTKKKDKKPVEVVVFEDPARRRSRAALNNGKSNITKPLPALDVIKRPVFNQKKAKFDIRKLAMTGMNKSEKEIAMADYLVDLGAKKPRNKHVDIKEYMHELKTKAEEDPTGESSKTTKDRFNQDDDSETKKPKYKRKRDKDDILGFVDGQIGTYKNGVQFIKPGMFGKKRRK